MTTGGGLEGQAHGLLQRGGAWPAAELRQVGVRVQGGVVDHGERCVDDRGLQPLRAGIQAQAGNQLELVTSFDATKGELPEGVAIDKPGNIYVSLGPPFFVGGGYGAVLRISPDGNKTKLLKC